MKQLHALVSGRVQGVSYRAFIQRSATQLRLAGWVRNLRDGRVEFTAAGDAAALEELLTLAKRGPPAAAVSGVIESWREPAEDFAGFSILTDGV
jgi:acylphosphatase